MLEHHFRSILISVLVLLSGIIAGGLLWFLFGATSLPAGIGWYLFSFASGLTMIVLPCTLPLAFVIVPLSMKKGMVKGVGIALAFGLGIAVTLSMYGVLAAIVGKVALGSLQVELESVKNWVYFIAGIFAYIFALGEIGIINVRMPSYTGSAPGFIQKQQEYIKAFLLGLFLGNIGVGCPHPATPLLLVEIASSANIFYGWTLFLMHAVGRILPLLFLAFLGILGVNGLSWLVARKDKVERSVGWAMVFVAGFILVLGLFTHDWWVNSGIHTQFEAFTQEERLIGIIKGNLNSEVTHSHGIAEGTGLFGLPLYLGNWVLVLLWILPIWIWWYKGRKKYYGSPAMRIEALEAELEKVEKMRRQVEQEVNMDDIIKNASIAELEQRIDSARQARTEAEESVNFGEKDETFTLPLARKYEKIIMYLKRNLYILLSILLGFIFIYYLPHNFLEHSAVEHPHDDNTEMHDHDDMAMDHESVNSSLPGATFSRVADGLAMASDTKVVYLKHGDTYSIEASIVKKEVGNRILKMLAYNGSVPGPIIRVEQGAEITIQFTNNTDIESTIHSHGVRVNNRFDGVAGVTQEPVQIGDTFVYKIKFPDAGVYWYHPHIREDYAQDQGLYGNYIVEPLDKDYWSPVNREAPLVLDDVLLEDGEIAPFYKDFVNFALLGRFGNTMLVNGKQDYVMNVKTGEVVRFLITNVASVRPFNITIPGARLKLVGADIGKYEQEEFIDNFLIMPAERVVVEAYFGKPGLYKIKNATPEQKYDIAYIQVAEQNTEQSFLSQFNTLRLNRDVADELFRLRGYFNKTADKRLRLSVDMGGAQMNHDMHAHDSDKISPVSPEEKIQWDDVSQSDVVNTNKTIVWKMIDMDTGRENMDIDWRFRVGDIVKVSIFNDPSAEHNMQHPIHFHGQRFLILSRNGVEVANKAWKDTVQVLSGETVDILIEMSNPGEWMSHCHIAEHLHSGMMFGFRVEDKDARAEGDAYRAQARVTESTGGGLIDSSKTLGHDGGYSISRLLNNDPTPVGIPTTLTFTAMGRSEEDKQMLINNMEPYIGGEMVRIFGVREQGDEFFVMYANEVEPGIYEGMFRFLLPGIYKLFAEVNLPGGMGTPTPIFSQTDLQVGDANEESRVKNLISVKPIQSNVIVGDYQVELTHTELLARARAVMNFTVSDVFGGGVELEEFGGGIMQVDIFNDDFSYYRHLFPSAHLDEVDQAPVDDHHEQDDGHTDHTHSSLFNSFVTRAMAHGDIPGAVEGSSINVFDIGLGDTGAYTMIVYFRPANSGLPTGRYLTAVFHVLVPGPAVGSVLTREKSAQDIHAHEEIFTMGPWYMSTRWWGLLIVSLVLMSMLSLGVRRFLQN